MNIDPENIITYPDVKFENDEKGNMTYMKDPDGVETWWTRNDKGQVIAMKNSNSYWMERELDENGNCIHLKNSDGLEYWGTVKPNGDPLTYKDNEGYEETYTYNDKDQLIRYENNQNEWDEYVYDEAGNSTGVKSHDGFESNNEFDSEGKVIRRWNSDGEEETFTYLENGNTLRVFTGADGVREDYETNPDGKPVRYKSEDIEEFIERNEKGYVVRFYNTKGLDVSYEVDEHGKIIGETINGKPEDEDDTDA